MVRIAISGLLPKDKLLIAIMIGNLQVIMANIS
jgi:hypothetical protein